MLEADPFAILEIEPTLDRHAIKLAYFAATRRVPPHADPEGFRKIRSAYEELTNLERARRAWLRAPVGAETLLEHWNARFRARIDGACAEQRASTTRDRSLELFIERCARVRLEDLERSA